MPVLPTRAAAFSGDTLNFNNGNISMFTAGLNYKFGGWWGIITRKK